MGLIKYNIILGGFLSLKGRISSLLFNLKFILSVHTLIAASVAGFLAFNYFFGYGILENAHLKYMRYLMKDVVLVHNFSGSGGTGWITKVKDKRYVITNAHVCGLAYDNTIIVNYRGEDYVVTVVKIYPKHDLCAIEAPISAKGGFRIASSTERGESVYTLGHPYLEPHTITKGELSGIVMVSIANREMSQKECVGEGYRWQDLRGTLYELAGIEGMCLRSLISEASPVPILPGNSGSPTVNIYGNVVAVAFAANEPGTRSYHVPIGYIKKFLSELGDAQP